MKKKLHPDAKMLKKKNTNYITRLPYLSVRQLTW